MGSVNLSPGRLAVLVALVVGGVAVMMNGFGDDGATMASGPSGVETTPTETPGATDATSAPPTETTPPPLEPQVENVVVQVLNGTDATGLAGQVKLLLEAKGYQADPEPGDLTSKPVLGTTVYFQAGNDPAQNEADAENLAAEYLKRVDARVRPLNGALSDEGALDPSAQLVVVLGDDYAEAHPVA